MKPLNQKGQTLLIAAVIIFALASYALILSGTLIQAAQVNRLWQNRMRALWIAEAGLSQAHWCLAQETGTYCGGTFGDSYVGEAVSFGGGSFTTTLSGSGEERIVTSVGTYAGTTRTIRQGFVKTSGLVTTSIRYAALSGDTGIVLDGSSHVSGDIYSRGDVTCSSSATLDNNITVAGVHTIDGCNITGSVRSNTIDDCDINGDAYYQTIINSTVGGTMHPGSPNPGRIDFPITQDMIDFWKQEAADGGVHEGDYKVSRDGSSVGPLKITGSLEVDAAMTLTGTVFVEGSIAVNKDVTLAAAYGDASGVLMASGTINVKTGTGFSGSGTGSYVLLLTESSASPAVYLGGGTPYEYIVYAGSGEVELKSGAKVMHVIADSLLLNSGSHIDYDPALVDITFLGDILAPKIWEVKQGTRSE